MSGPGTPRKRLGRAESSARGMQYKRIEKMLEAGHKSTIDLRHGGIMMPSVRVKEMNARGWKIIRVALRDMFDEWGFLHPRVAVYEMLERPDCGCAQ